MKTNKILLIDDDHVSNYLTELKLKSENIADQVVVATNGEEGLQELKRMYEDKDDLPDMILLDISMPVMDGFEFMQEYIKTGIDKPEVIVLTSSSNPNDVERMNSFNIKGYINKPLSTDNLKELMHDGCEK